MSQPDSPTSSPSLKREYNKWHEQVACCPRLAGLYHHSDHPENTDRWLILSYMRDYAQLGPKTARLIFLERWGDTLKSDAAAEIKRLTSTLNTYFSFSLYTCTCPWHTSNYRIVPVTRSQ